MFKNNNKTNLVGNSAFFVEKPPTSIKEHLAIIRKNNAIVKSDTKSDVLDQLETSGVYPSDNFLSDLKRVTEGETLCQEESAQSKQAIKALAEKDLNLRKSDAFRQMQRESTEEFFVDSITHDEAKKTEQTQAEKPSRLERKNAFRQTQNNGESSLNLNSQASLEEILAEMKKAKNEIQRLKGMIAFCEKSCPSDPNLASEILKFETASRLALEGSQDRFNQAKERYEAMLRNKSRLNTHQTHSEVSTPSAHF